jgi:hypothetical protein
MLVWLLRPPEELVHQKIPATNVTTPNRYARPKNWFTKKPSSTKYNKAESNKCYVSRETYRRKKARTWRA